MRFNILKGVLPLLAILKSTVFASQLYTINNEGQLRYALKQGNKKIDRDHVELRLDSDISLGNSGILFLTDSDGSGFTPPLTGLPLRNKSWTINGQNKTFNSNI